MRNRTWMVVLAALAIAAPGWSQEVIRRRVTVGEASAGATWVGEGQGVADAVFLHGPGFRFEGPAKKGAPYSAEAVTETVQALSDGNRIKRENRAKIYRDSDGRTRREEKLGAVGPWAVAGEQPTRVFINDPVAGEHWVLEPENKIARKMKIPNMGERVGRIAGVEADVNVDVTVEAEAGGPPTRTRIERRELQIQQGSAIAGASAAEKPKVEDLGTRMIEGLQAKGTKITRTIPTGQIGNERPIEVVFEQWRSEELGVDVMTTRSDPRSAETTYKLTDIQRTEPLAGLFQPPPDYEVTEPEGNVFIQRIEKK